jgi:hypothetical protein
MWNTVTKSKKELDSRESKIDLHSDSWERFERAVDMVIKHVPMHRQRPQNAQKERLASKGRVHKGKSRT